LSAVRGLWTTLFVLLGISLLVAALSTRSAIIALAAPLIRNDPLRSVDAIVILGEGALADGTLTPSTAYALLRGLELWRRGWAPVLVLSGGSHRGSPTSDADAMAVALRHLGVAPSSLLIDTRASSTSAHAAAVADLARRHGFRSVAVVTSPLRSRRAALAFRRVGLDVISTPGAGDPRQLLVARDDPVGRWMIMLEALTEYAALILYRLRGHA
jgi:uncharacterized SAM-binding protein YcdF (DUF218 family)